MSIQIATADDFDALSKKMDRLIELMEKARPVVSQDRIHTNEELCSRLNICSKTLQGYRDKGMINFQQVGRKIFYTEDDVDAFLMSHRIKGHNLKEGRASRRHLLELLNEK